MIPALRRPAGHRDCHSLPTDRTVTERLAGTEKITVTGSLSSRLDNWSAHIPSQVYIFYRRIINLGWPRRGPWPRLAGRPGRPASVRRIRVAGPEQRWGRRNKNGQAFADSPDSPDFFHLPRVHCLFGFQWPVSFQIPTFESVAVFSDKKETAPLDGKHVRRPFCGRG